MMTILVLYCLFGVYLIAQKRRGVRLAGFFLSTIGALIWMVYGYCVNDYNVVLQFFGYVVVNVIGIYNNWRNSTQDVQKETDD